MGGHLSRGVAARAEASTASLWGQRINNVSIGENTAFAVSETGQVYEAGGGWVAKALVNGGILPPDIAGDDAFFIAANFLSRPNGEVQLHALQNAPAFYNHHLREFG